MQFHFLTEMKQMFLLRQRQKDRHQNNKSKQINTNNKKYTTSELQKKNS